MRFREGGSQEGKERKGGGVSSNRFPLRRRCARRSPFEASLLPSRFFTLNRDLVHRRSLSTATNLTGWLPQETLEGSPFPTTRTIL